MERGSERKCKRERNKERERDESGVSSMDLPTKEECEGWSPIQVAHFLSQNLSESDLSRFSLMHQP
ncbi:hypothetical protein JZ751_011067 [Albula glossodonta]|uniref:Uncharacterized protein n=1 Tax=Albula glossodonta TaxID=121402 RepID=A0A8T2P6X0_9TELE|nr:hypothetical protein JZ751_011067 [Albula glossodonta]